MRQGTSIATGIFSMAARRRPMLGGLALAGLVMVAAGWPLLFGALKSGATQTPVIRFDKTMAGNVVGVLVVVAVGGGRAGAVERLRRSVAGREVV